MNRSIFIADRLREVFLSGSWMASTNYKQQLATISWEQAIQKVGTLNTIATLTYHVNYYVVGLLEVLDGGALSIRDQYSFDLPPIQSEAEWKALVQEFLSNAEQFILQVEKISDQQLEEVFVEEKYGTYLRNLEGVIEHSYYHLGQISLIRKLVAV
ncbi:MAG: DinB family protein [Bacteroidota bacterium]